MHTSHSSTSKSKTEVPPQATARPDCSFLLPAESGLCTLPPSSSLQPLLTQSKFTRTCLLAQLNALGGHSHYVFAISCGSVTTLSALSILSTSSFLCSQQWAAGFCYGRVEPCTLHSSLVLPAPSTARAGRGLS